VKRIKVKVKDQSHYFSTTPCTNMGASRIDRLYVFQALYCTKIGIETVAAGFTDHFAVVLRLALGAPHLVRGRGLWKMNVSLLQDAEFSATVGRVWNGCCARKKEFPNVVMWWVRHVKRVLKWTFIREGTERRRDQRKMENAYYEVIYELVARLRAAFSGR
jgi:hypothetical protein